MAGEYLMETGVESERKTVKCLVLNQRAVILTRNAMKVKDDSFIEAFPMT